MVYQDGFAQGQSYTQAWANMGIERKSYDDTPGLILKHGASVFTSRRHFLKEFSTLYGAWKSDDTFFQIFYKFERLYEP